MSRKSRRLNRQIRALQRNQKSLHLQLKGYANEYDYTETWKQLTNPRMSQEHKKRQAIIHWWTLVKHDECIPVPWSWSTELTDPLTKRKYTVKDKHKKETNALYTQGGALFLIRDGLSQKLTESHMVTVVDEDNNVFTKSAGMIAYWTENHQRRAKGGIDPRSEESHE